MFVCAPKAAQRAHFDVYRAVRGRIQCSYAAAARRAVRCASLGAAVKPGAAFARVRCRQRRNTPAGLRGYSQTDQAGCVVSWMCAGRGSARRGAACKRRKSAPSAVACLRAAEPGLGLSAGANDGL